MDYTYSCFKGFYVSGFIFFWVTDFIRVYHKIDITHVFTVTIFTVIFSGLKILQATDFTGSRIFQVSVYVKIHNLQGSLRFLLLLGFENTPLKSKVGIPTNGKMSSIVLVYIF